MKKIYRLLLAMLLVLGVLAACGNQVEQEANENTGENKEEVTENEEKEEETKQTEDAFPVTIEDARGEKIVLDKEPEKIISLMPSNTEIVFALGKGDALVGASTEFDNYPEEVEDLPKVASGFSLNVEQVLSLEPDLVLAHESILYTWEAGIQQIEDSDIPLIVIPDAQSFDKVFASIELIGKAIGATEEAEALVQEMKGKLDVIKEKAANISEDDRKTVFVEVSPAPEIYTTGKNTFMHEMLDAINAINAAGDQEGWIAMNEEAIVAINPDVIITTVGFVENAVEEIKSRSAWQDIEAVKNDDVYLVDEDLVSRSGPRIIEGVEELARAIYPEVFGE